MYEFNLSEISAIIGSIFFLTAYLYINRRDDATNDLLYVSINLIAAILMLISLIEFWNVGVLINNSFWIVISVFSITKHFKKKWWSYAGSNRRPPECKSGALPAEL